MCMSLSQCLCVCVSCRDIWDYASTCRRKGNVMNPTPLPSVTSIVLVVLETIWICYPMLNRKPHFNSTAGTKKLVHTSRELNGGVILQSASRGHCRTFFHRAQRIRGTEEYNIEPIWCRGREQKKGRGVQTLLLSVPSQHITCLCWKTSSRELRQTSKFNVVSQFARIVRQKASLENVVSV